MKKLLLIAVVSVFAFYACKKDTVTKTDLLTQHSWKQTGFTLNGVSLYDSLDACEKDNIYTFSTSFTYKKDEGATKCNSTDPQTIESGNWAFTSSESKLSVVPTGGTPTVSDILQLDENTLKLSLSVQDSLLGNFTIVSTYGKN